MEKSNYQPRIVEGRAKALLRSHGAILLTGAKAVGKTTTAETLAASAIFLDRDGAALAAAEADPHLALSGESPRLIDEFQLAEGIWGAVRGRIDELGKKGLFLLTGSATPDPDATSHSGAGRIAPIPMRTMSFFERGLSTGHVAIGDLLAGDVKTGGTYGFTVTEAVEALSTGGWPGHLGLSPEESLDANRAYLETIINTDVERVDQVARDPDGVRRLLASYARNTATYAALTTIGKSAEEPLSKTTLHNYLRALRRLYLIEEQPNWKPALCSRVRLAATPKRHLADPSLAVAALGATPERLLGPEIELAGFLFESQVVHDLRVYAQPHRAQVRHYRDNKGLEVDAIVEATDGRWVALEVKLGHHWVGEGAKNLLALHKKVADNVRARCGALVVVVADSPTYRRPDGVLVTSVAALGP